MTERTAPPLVQRLGRIMSPGRRLIPEIDGLRFVAIGVVFLFHSRNWVRQLVGPAVADQHFVYRALGHGDYGVQLFFVISGFLLAVPFAREHLVGGRSISLGAYYKRRLTRLEPPYLVAMSLLFLAGILTGRPRAVEMWPNFLAGLLYQHNQIFGSVNHVNGVAWSLEVEVQFYVLTPLLAGLFLIRSDGWRRGLLAALILVIGMIALYLEPNHVRWKLSLLGHLHEFFAGYLLADYYVKDWKEAPREDLRWDLATLVTWPGMLVILMSAESLKPLLPFLVLAAYAAALRGPLTRRLFSTPWLVTIGGMCYTIYLLHQPIIQQLGAVLGPRLGALGPLPSLALWVGIFAPVVLVVSALFFALVEQPCMNPQWPALLYARAKDWLSLRAA